MVVTRLQHATIVIVVVTFVGLFGFQAVSPALPGMRDALEISTQHIGWVMTAYALPAFLFVPLAGLWADRYGKKVMLIASLLIYGVAGGLIVHAPDAMTVFILRFIQGIGGSAIITLNYALLGDLFSGPTRTRLAGWLGAIQNVGSSAVPIVAGALATISWYWPFALLWLAVPTAIHAILFLDESQEQKPTAKGGAFLGHAWTHLASRPVIETLIMTGGFIFVGFGALITYLPLYMKDTFNAPEILIGVVMGARAISGVFMAAGLAWAEARFSQRTLVAVAFVGMAASSGIVPFAPNIWGLLASSIIYGAAFGIIRPMLQLKLLDLSPPDLRTTLSSAGTFALRVGQAVSPIAAGAYLAFGDYDGMYFLFAAIALGFAVYAFWAQCLQPGIKAEPK